MKKGPFIIAFIFLAIVISIMAFFSPFKNSYSYVDNATYSRKDLQNMVVSTAYSYYNNRSYSDYEQKTLTDNQRFHWTNYNVSPESMSRSNYLTTSCAAFTTTVYDYALNFNFSDYYKIQAKEKFGDVTDDTSYNYIRYKLGYLGQTDELNRIGKYCTLYTENAKSEHCEVDDPSWTHEGRNNSKTDLSHAPITIMNEYVSTCTDYKKNNYSECSYTVDTKATINNIKNILEPGDIFVYRHLKKDGSYYKLLKGHAAIYIGDGKFIHSTGVDFDITKSPIQIGDDHAIALNNPNSEKDAIRISSVEGMLSALFHTKENDTRTVSITILRPINAFCNNNSCDLYKYCKNDECNKIKNTLARNKYRNLKYEQYVVDSESNSHISYDYNSINYGDKISYVLSLNGKHNDLIIEAKIPNNSEFISASKGFKNSNGVISWTNQDINNTEKKYIITVLNKNKNNISFDGFNIKTSDKKYELKLSKVLIEVNPTLNGNKANKLKEEYNNKNHNNSDSLKYIKNVYKESYNIDFSDISFTYKDIKNAIFEKNKNKDNSYLRKKSSNNTISKMLVPGMYGGRSVDGNTLGDRIRYIKSKFLEVGDIIVTYKGNETKAYLFLGFKDDCAILASNYNLIYHTGNISGYRVIKEVHASDFFVVLRPSRVYGSTVVYNYNGATKKCEDSYIAYKKYGTLCTPQKTGYTFEGWFSDKNFKNKVTKDSVISNDTKVYNLYAKWYNGESQYTVEHYKENLNNSDYTLANTDIIKAQKGKTYNVERKNYTGFIQPELQTITVNDSNTQVIKYYYKRGKYTLNLNSGEGVLSTSGNGTYKYGQSVTIKATLKSGYDWVAWMKDNKVSCRKQTCTFPKNETNATLVATAKLKTFYIEFDKQGGSEGTSKLLVTYTKQMDNISIPKRTGYLFNGYYTEPNSNGEKYFDSNGKGVKTYNKLSDIKLYASWTNITYNVSYNSNGGSGTMSSSKHTYGVKSNLSENKFTKQGYYFLGWSKDKSSSVANYYDKQEITSLSSTNGSTVTLYAIYAPQGDTKYTVIHYKQNIDATSYYVSEREIKSGTTNSQVIPKVKTYTGFKSPDEKELTIKSDGSAVLKYYYDRLSYGIVLKKGKGINSVSGEGSYKYLEPFTIDADVKEGYTFLNWFYVEGNKEYTKMKTYNGTKGAYTRTYQANAKANDYKVLFDSNGGTGKMSSQAFVYDTKDKLKANEFKKENSEFLGWSTNRESTTVEYKNKQEVINLTKINNDEIVLYAIWKEKIVDVQEEEIEEPHEIIIEEIPKEEEEKIPKNEKVVVVSEEEYEKIQEEKQNTEVKEETDVQYIVESTEEDVSEEEPVVINKTKTYNLQKILLLCFGGFLIIIVIISLIIKKKDYYN